MKKIFLRLALCGMLLLPITQHLQAEESSQETTIPTANISPEEQDKVIFTCLHLWYRNHPNLYDVSKIEKKDLPVIIAAFLALGCLVILTTK